MGSEKEAVDKSAFDRVIGYFLNHEKPMDEAPKAPKRIDKPRKKPSTKPKKRD